MISITKEYKYDIFENNEDILYFVNSQVVIQPISKTRIEAKVVSTKDFDKNYNRQLEYCYEDSKNLIEKCFFHGYKAWIFEMGPLLTPAKLQSIKQFVPFGTLRKKGLDDVVNIQKCYKFHDGVKYAGLFSVNPNHFYDACLYVQETANAVIIFSKREAFFSESNLDKLLYSGTYIRNDVRISYINWVAVCLVVCPLGDILFNPGGGFDDLFRSINFYFCGSSLDFELQE